MCELQFVDVTVAVLPAPGFRQRRVGQHSGARRERAGLKYDFPTAAGSGPNVHHATGHQTSALQAAETRVTLRFKTRRQQYDSARTDLTRDLPPNCNRHATVPGQRNRAVLV